MDINKKIILIIDDDGINRTLVETYLKGQGYMVIVTESGKEGLQILKDPVNRVDMVLLDLLMPEMDGFDVLKHMKSMVNCRHIPVIVTSGQTDQDSIVRCIEMGAVDYMIKPFDPVLLDTRVKNVLHASAELMPDGSDRSARMLVVDDDFLYRTMLTVNLEEKGFTVDQAENGQVALNNLETQTYDLIFLDLLMPEMDGFETLERIKADSGKQQIPVIIISGEDDMSSIVKCIEMGAIDYLNKPFDDAILTARVNACLTVNRFKEMEKSYFKLIHDERNKSDKLLLNILPKPISDRLKNGEKTIADFFPEVTVLFCDIVEFTRLSSIMEPDNIVMLLNKLFSMFDALVEKFDLEKIKTIGDAYMLVGGVPTPRSDHAEAVADMAIEMCESVRLFNRDNPEIPISVRIGIHSGPVIAGVIGIRKFSYDLWGDTVNTASRMESCGIVDKIHVSHDTYQILKKSYSFHPRGTIIIKGKGKMETYLLENKLTPTS